MTSIENVSDLQRIARSFNVEAIIEAWIEKHGYVITDKNIVLRDHNELAVFPIYELALQYALDKVQEDIERELLNALDGTKDRLRNELAEARMEVRRLSLRNNPPTVTPELNTEKESS